MPHNGRLFEMPPSQQIDCSDFSVCTHLRKNQTQLTGLGLFCSVVLLNASPSESPQRFWGSAVTTAVSFTPWPQVTAHCGIFWVRWPSVQTPDGRPTAAAVFLLFDAFFQSIAESDAKSLSFMQRSAGEFCYSRTAEVCRLSSECCCTHTHCAGACSLLHHFAFIFILFSCTFDFKVT